MAHFRQRQLLFYSSVIFLFLLVTLVLRNLTDQLETETFVTLSDVEPLQPLQSLQSLQSLPSLPSLQSLQWDTGGPTNYFWRGDSECGEYGTRFVVRHSLRARALVSYPGSGNTWTRYQSAPLSLLCSDWQKMHRKGPFCQITGLWMP